MRVELLTLNFSLKDGLRIVSKTKMKNCWSMIDQGLRSGIKLHRKFTIHKNCVKQFLFTYFFEKDLSKL